jgi:hypothetical protein|tara:strand:+ start:447 stop:620 length:174 start_codon:yes stop_codon:yes gene_type:complete
MPMVTYKTAKGMKTKQFPYNKMGMEQAKKMASETGGKLNKSINSAGKMKMKKSKAYA